jgi:hypothetical protein
MVQAEMNVGLTIEDCGWKDRFFHSQSSIRNHQYEEWRGQAMRNLLALFAAALLTVVGVGWYLGWYKVRSQPASVPGQHSVNIDIDTNKIGTDLQKGEQKLQQFLDRKNGEDAKKADGGLMLPSPSGSKEKPNGNSTPLFQFHNSSTGVPSVEIGGGLKHPLLQIGGSDKK